MKVEDEAPTGFPGVAVPPAIAVAAPGLQRPGAAFTIQLLLVALWVVSYR